MQAEAKDAVGESHAELDRSARSLDQLASAIESGAVRGERDLDREFVHVPRTLATDQLVPSAGSGIPADARHLPPPQALASSLIGDNDEVT